MPNPNATLVTLDYPPERGGVARYLGCLVEASQGAVDVLVASDHVLSGPGQVRTAEFFWPLWPKWLPLVRRCFSLKKTRKMILVSHAFPVGTAAWLSNLFGGPEYAIFFHGLDLRLVQDPWKTFLLRQMSFSSKALFVNSEATKKELEARVPGIKSEIIFPGVENYPVPPREEARRSLGISSDRHIVLTIARFVARKGIDLTLQAMAEVQKAHPEADYVVIGEGMDAERLAGIAKEHSTNVRFVAPPTDEEKWKWYAAADLFVMPARETPTDMEGFGIVYLEAAHAGIPSIAGKSGGAGEAVLDGETGLLVDPNSVEEIGEAIRRLLDDEALRLRLGAAAKARADQGFRWEDRWAKVAKTLGF